MKNFYLDLHIHIGCSNDGRPVKITASRDLTLLNILNECLARKGIDMIGVVDCGSPGVLADLYTLLQEGKLVPLSQGGFRYGEKITIFTGIEMEAKENSGRRAHYLAFFPTLERLQDFAAFVAVHVKNPQLSTQATNLRALTLLKVVKSMGGIFIPAHVFTPHKGVYGACASSLTQVFGAEAESIKAVELGLSADRNMAMLLPELRERVFFSNSDAHSLEKIGREYNLVVLEEPTFNEFVYLLEKKKGRYLKANYGLDPQLGKYHRSFCNKCQVSLLQDEAVTACPLCGSREHVVVGVLDRIMAIAPAGEKEFGTIPYYYQVPLPFLPGVGKKTIEKLLLTFGSEMNILHQAGPEELAKIVSNEVVELIMKARKGKLKFEPGAGGKYGRIMGE
jgi:uncharacterized protein (TIGR00375 family)